MLLSSLLDPEFIKTKIKVNNFDEIVDLLLDDISNKYGMQSDKSVIRHAIHEREELGGIVLETGLAIPHARIESFNDIAIAMATLKNPIEYQGSQVSMVVLILTARSTSNLYLNSLSAFARIAQNTEVYSKIIASQNSQEILGLISGLGIEIKRGLTVEHVMSKPLGMITATNSLKTGIDLYVEQNLSYLAVVDDEGKLIGELTVLDILHLGIPNYLQMIGNEGFTSSFEPFEDLLQKEEEIKVSDVMEAPGHYFKRETSLVSAISTFSRTRRRQIPVLDDGKLIGVVSYMDIIRKVLRG